MRFKRQDPYKWHAFLVLIPRVIDNEWVWIEVCERRKKHYLGVGGWGYDYRHKQGEV